MGRNLKVDLQPGDRVEINPHGENVNVSSKSGDWRDSINPFSMPSQQPIVVDSTSGGK